MTRVSSIAGALGRLKLRTREDNDDHMRFNAARPAACPVSPAIRRGDTIFSKGDPGNSLYAVCTGTVKISVPSADGKEAVFNLETPLVVR